jgi:galactitol-specific phosphotransferase system IIB component
MKRLLLLFVCGGFFASAAMAADPYEKWLTKQSQRGVELEMIRVASEKPLVEAEETDAEVATILKEVEAIEEESGETEKGEDS